MLVWEKHKNLQLLNTFGITTIAKRYTQINNLEDAKQALAQIIEWQQQPLILGGGSNILFTKDEQPLVVYNNINGIEVVGETAHDIELRIGAGEPWQKVVTYCVQHNYWGIENLALIPGSAGAAPIQNIGAYGVEVKMVLTKVEGLFLSNNEPFSFNNDDCAFGYRTSIFKTKLKNKCLITHVNLLLHKEFVPLLRYKGLQDYLQAINISDPTGLDVYNAVIAVRQSKLPNPALIGNAGSFFKNPEIPKAQANLLLQKHPTMVQFAGAEGLIKLAAGWLIESCGFKGYTKGQAGCYEKQALVLINIGQATGLEIVALSKEIQDKVFEKFGVWLTPEVNIL
jgi:UDP-N-acetylmuramate dehydrogenase